MIPPRAQLKISAVSFISLNCSVEIECSVSGVSGTWIVITSALVNTSSMFSYNSTPMFLATSGGKYGSYAIASISNALHLFTTWDPILPIPITPRVLFLSSIPINAFFSHFPALVDLSAIAILRIVLKMSPIVCSATVIEVDSGALTTIIPFWVAAFTSTLSTPTPALAMILRLSAFSMTSAGNLVLLLMRIASYSPMVSSNSSGVMLVSTTTSQTSFKFSIPFSFIASATNAFIISPFFI